MKPRFFSAFLITLVAVVAAIAYGASTATPATVGTQPASAETTTTVAAS